MSHFTSQTDETPAPAMRSPWFWFAVLIVPFVLFFVILGVWSAAEKWHILSSPPGQHATIERSGAAPWLPQERRADMERRITQIDKEIPAVLEQMKFLGTALQKETARVSTNAEAKEYVNFIRTEQHALEQRLENLRSDRAYYVRELHEK